MNLATVAAGEGYAGLGAQRTAGRNSSDSERAALINEQWDEVFGGIPGNATSGRLHGELGPNDGWYVNAEGVTQRTYKIPSHTEGELPTLVIQARDEPPQQSTAGSAAELLGPDFQMQPTSAVNQPVNSEVWNDEAPAGGTIFDLANRNAATVKTAISAQGWRDLFNSLSTPYYNAAMGESGHADMVVQPNVAQTQSGLRTLGAAVSMGVDAYGNTLAVGAGSLMGRAARVGNAERLAVEGTASYHQTTNLWTPNASGARTMAEARTIAENNGAYLADDVHFIPVADALYDSKFGNSYATYGRFTVSDPNAPVMWKASSSTSSGIADSTGRINVWVRQSVLESDQAITAVLGHETFEIEALRPAFQQNGGALPAKTYSNLVRPGVPNNIHWQAVDFGDQLVRDMLGLGGKP
jgi:hypothetical protein